MTDRIHFNVCRFLLFRRTGDVLCLLEAARWEKHHCQRAGRCVAAQDSAGKQITKKFFEELARND